MKSEAVRTVAPTRKRLGSGIVPCDSPLIFEVEVLQTDDRSVMLRAERTSGGYPQKPGAMVHPWWLARVELPPPPAYYLNFCAYLKQESMPASWRR